MLSFSRPNLRRIIAGVAATAASLTLSLSLAAPSSASPVVNKTITPQSVGVQMFMWPWASLQDECTDVLGPEGVDWILVSPPQEDIKGKEWWTHYQPVAYNLNSQLGAEQQFRDMVDACNGAGVQVIVDAVVNHMASRSGDGFYGTQRSKYNYPGLYSPLDFHAGLDPSSPRYCNHDITNYNSNFEVINCELVSLPDLATEKDSVRQTIADYLNGLVAMGVAGFRIDAAKHIGYDDLSAIVKLLNPTSNGTQPYIVSEVIGSTLDNQQWTQLGDVFGWTYQNQFKSAFNKNIGALKPSNNQSVIYGDASKTIAMVSNHDQEHDEGGPRAITYLEPAKYLAASALLLADNRGKPMLYSGYAFDLYEPTLGPAQDSNNNYLPAACPSGSKSLTPQKSYKVGSFTCMQRWTGIRGMIQWHHEVGNAPVANTIVKGQFMGFTRGTGYFAINNNPVKTKGSLTVTVKTGLPKGTYCDVVSGGASPKTKVKGKAACRGTTVTVATNGTAKLSIPSMTALAFDSASKLK